MTEPKVTAVILPHGRLVEVDSEFVERYLAVQRAARDLSRAILAHPPTQSGVHTLEIDFEKVYSAQSRLKSLVGS